CDQAIPHQLTGFSPTAGGTGIWTGTGVTTAGVFNSPGVGAYVLTYTFTNANGCVNSDNITVTVVAPVIANAGPDVTLCQNEGVFVPSGYVPAIGGTWSGAGIINAGSGTFNPNVSGTGTFVITLSYGSGTCFTSDQMEITVLAPPAVNAGPNQSVCGNLEPFNLSGFSPATGGTWEGTGIINASAGTFDPGVLPATYNLLYWYVDPMTGCADSANKQVTVHPVPVANFSVAPLGCTNANVDLINTSTGATTYAWDFGNSFTANGIDPPYTYPDEGIYDIELVAFNAFMCSDTAMNSNEIIDPPSAELSIDPADGCAPLTVTFNNLSVGQYLTYTWDLAIGSSSDPVPAPTIYYQGEDDLVYPISLTATNFCGSDIAEDEILVYPQPVAGFGTNLDVFCSPFTVEFNNTSVGNPDYYLWDFGDGTFSSLEEPGSHVFFADTIPVEYNIWLYLENECGIDSSDYTITVLPNTVTAFFNTNVTEGCSPLQVEFTDFSEGGTYIQYDFDDGTFTGNANPVHVFVDPGFYTIEQFVDNGCSFDTTEITIEVFASPDIDFDTDVDFLCVNESVVFDADPGSAISLTWDFGDGGTSDLSDPAHQYLQNGTFDVVLTGTNANGCESSVTHPVSVYAAPDASFTIPDQVGCSPFTVAFSNATSGGLFYEWDFGDGNTDIDEDPSNTYYNVGSEPVLYTVTLVVENIQLCADTFQMDVIVSPQPTSAFMLSAFESCYFPAEINVSNISVDALAYDWYVNGDFYSDLTEPEFEFSAVGEYDVELVASNQYGCEASSNATFTVHPLPVAALSADPLNGCVNLTVDFSNGSVGAQSYVWDFGDGSTAIGENPQHTYTTPGLYDISLIATTDMGCSDTLEVENYVEAYNLPIAGFNMSPEVTTIYEPIITFIDDSFDASAWFWAFGDGTDATQPNIQHTYAEAGTWHITLTVWNEHGCTDDVTDVVVIDDIFDIFVPNAFTPDDDDINEYFKPAMSGTAFIERYRFQIFDRWGTIIFETEDPNAAWTGNVRNGEYYAKDDAYNWQVIVQLKGYDEERVYSGHVILVR
ncbi:MAG: PKD domain-containing protein, partial [Flavobacteriales bacterium]|nr:PKD domain-containing protein [Flavobacteriales bacterium]